MTTFEFIGIVILSIILTIILLICYLKLLSVIGNKLQPYSRKQGRKESEIIVCGVYCFDKAYNSFNTYIIARISRIIKNFIWHKPISNNGSNSNEQCWCKSDNTNPESLLKECQANKSNICEGKPSARSKENRKEKRITRDKKTR